MSLVNFIDDAVLLAALKTRIEALDHPTLSGAKLFERVDFHENRNLGDALRDLVITKQRVCLIVPQGEAFETSRDGSSVKILRQFAFDLLIADRAWTKGGHDAVFGGASNIGVMKMAALTRDWLLAEPQLGLDRFVALAPTDSAMITLADEKVKDVPGRECWVLAWETPAGETTYSVNP